MTKLLKQTHESPIKPVNGSRKLSERELSSGSPTTFVTSFPFLSRARWTPRARQLSPRSTRYENMEERENRGTN